MVFSPISERSGSDGSCGAEGDSLPLSEGVVVLPLPPLLPSEGVTLPLLSFDGLLFPPSEGFEGLLSDGVTAVPPVVPIAPCPPTCERIVRLTPVTTSRVTASCVTVSVRTLRLTSSPSSRTICA